MLAVETPYLESTSQATLTGTRSGAGVASAAAAFDALTDRGWRLARTARGELRLVCMPHVTRDTLAAFVRDVDDCRGE